MRPDRDAIAPILIIIVFMILGWLRMLDEEAYGRTPPPPGYPVTERY